MPGLIREGRPIHADQIVEGVGVAALLGDQEDRRALVSHNGLARDAELVALRLPAEDRVVVEHQTAAPPAPPATFFLEEDCRGEPADPAAHHDQVVHLPGVDRVSDRAVKRPVAQAMRRGHHVVHVAMRAGVVTDPTVAVPSLCGRKSGRRLERATEHQAGAREEGSVEEVTARDRLVHAEAIVRHPLVHRYSARS